MNHTDKYLAHTSDDSLQNQTLLDHALGVSNLTGLFATRFKSEEWGKLLGLWHDIGKLNPIFQSYITSSYKGNPPSKRERAHAALGAIALYKQLGPIAIPLTYCIEGHHAGLPNWYGDLDVKIKENDLYKLIESKVFLPKPTVPPFVLQLDEKSFHHWVRMLFSCLIDADRLDTEQFANPSQAAERGNYDSLEVLKGRLDKKLAQFSVGERANDKINQDRRTILSICKEKGKLPSGFYSLTVPTGGGKTLSSMAWALNHAIVNGKERIIVAIPYTSIIAQTADTFRKIFGSNNVLEHHSNLSKESEEEINKHQSVRLATENWDVPIVITTNVQLFESLHSNRPSDCRKIHNIANSVLILDEAQMLPIDFLDPIIQSLKSLVSHFGTSILFTTATQPALTGMVGLRQSQFKGIENVEELMPSPEELYYSFKRTQLHKFADDRKFTSEAMAKELLKHDSVLCVVNTRKQAQSLCQNMPKDTIHLSRNMYSAHLMRKIDEIKRLLKEGKAVRVVSTQLIEAGVDIDFPVVYRSFAGLDSIIQAAGRCNREGKLSMGDVYVFEWEEEKSFGTIKAGKETLSDMLYAESIEELALPPNITRYFANLYTKSVEMDKPQSDKYLYQNVGECKFQFEAYAKEFCLIDDKGSITVLIPLEEGLKIFEKISKGENLYLADYRTMQRYSVSIPSYIANDLIKSGAIEQWGEIHVINSAFYNLQYGLVSNGEWIEEFISI
ncbi:MAG: CRISPR-associated helicase Cas3' [Phocaeicola sp.]